MGCKQSKVSGEAKPAGVTAAPSTGNATPQKPAAATPAAAPKKTDPAEIFLRAILPDAEEFFSSRLPRLPEEDAAAPYPASFLQSAATVFLNSVVEYCRMAFRVKMNSSLELIRTVLQTKSGVLTAALNDVEDHVSDDGYMRLLGGWEVANPKHEKAINRIVAEALLKSADLAVMPHANVHQFTFLDILQWFTSSALANQEVCKLFKIYSADGLTMPADEYLAFMRGPQGQESVTERTAGDKIRNRFGGCVNRFNFASYHAGLITNSAFDPQRATNVWMDMTQPLPHYMIRTSRVQSEEDLQRALKENSRALVLSCRKDSLNGKIYSGNVLLQTIVEQVKLTGFRESAYPIVLCFDPETVLPLSVQDEVATLLKEKLGSMLARGIMFEGAMIHDPNFSPAALQRKVLIMGMQAPLKPFVGFHVADMNREGLGVRVTDVQKATPASKAGIARDDWITHINGVQIQNKLDLRQRLAQFQLGDEFTMKKENLDEVRVVVGGAVTGADGTASQALSDLIFLKLVVNTADHGHYFPWESSYVHPVPENVLKSATEESPLRSPQSPTRGELNERFMFISRTQPELHQRPSKGEGSPASTPLTINEDDDDCFVGNAATLGAQFMSADQTDVKAHAWARGMFANNAHCGYVLKPQPMNNPALPPSSPITSSFESAPVVHEVSITILAAPAIVGRHGVLSSVKFRVHGAGRCQRESTDDSRSIIISDYEESSVVTVVLCFTVTSGEETKSFSFTASFPPQLLRNGYRVLPALETKRELESSPVAHGIFCRIRTQREQTVSTS
eukprot:CAMPEP_0176408052 /NCGR_PEP_ID=MMETSP0127-20121128/1738_1 /TAXON_ID=938130 /ORGANISM="Platyophrya macrostoma, Strain WH" /LENGTH=792 /DNA_ID=CAMNT_0017787297 /DNA_START=141 /DNA_END=2519 /DNA_ORIENTATION=-